VLNVRKLAMRLLRQQHGKYPDFFDHQLGVGLELLFEFCKRLESVARARTTKARQQSGGDNTLLVPTITSEDDVNQGGAVHVESS
jgi:hypothetical protein